MQPMLQCYKLNFTYYAQYYAYVKDLCLRKQEYVNSHNYGHVRSRDPEKVNCLVRPVEVDKWPILTVAAISSRIVVSGG